jgi:hypothetical protein
MMCYDEMYLYHHKFQPDLESLWEMGDWGVEYSSDLNHFVLSDSPQSYYRDSANNYMSFIRAN